MFSGACSPRTLPRGGGIDRTWTKKASMFSGQDFFDRFTEGLAYDGDGDAEA